MIKIDKNQTKKLIADKLVKNLDEVINPTLCLAFNNNVYMFADAIKRGKNIGMDIIIIRNAKKESNEWFYDLNNSVITHLKSEYFTKINLPENIDNSAKIRVDISDIFENIQDQNDEIIEIENTYEISFDPDMNRDHLKMTKKEYICILLKVPKTGKKWIDELILQSRHLDKK